MKKFNWLIVLAIAASVSLSSCFVHAGVGTRHHRVGAGAGVGYIGNEKAIKGNS